MAASPDILPDDRYCRSRGCKLQERPYARRYRNHRRASAHRHDRGDHRPGHRFLGFALGRLLFPDQPLIVVGLLLTALLPTSGMTISWTGFARGNVLAAVKMTVLGLVLGSLATPLYLKLLMGAAIDVPLAEIFSQIILIVFLPMAAGYLTQRLLIRAYGYGSVMRNLSIALAVAMTAFGAAGSEIALIIALAYIIQVQAAWYVKLTDRIFGSAPAPAPPAQATGAR